MGKFTRTIFEYEDLRPDGAMEVVRGAPYGESATIRYFKASVGVGGNMALKYTGYYKQTGGNKHTFMLGWDHALLIERDLHSNIHYVRAIYAHGRSEDNREVRAYHLPMRGASNRLLNPTIAAIPKRDHSCGGHKVGDCEWRVFDLSGLNVRIEKLVTFGITSCSFACLWTHDKRFLVVSHVAFAPAIPLFWMLRTAAPDASRRPVRLLASLNTTTDEIDKFTVGKLLPYANEFHVDAKFLLRGPYKCRRAGILAPFKTHPYVSMFFAQSGNVYYGGAIGFNNEPDLEIEMPPFHSTIGNAMAAYGNCNNARAILKEADLLLGGEYGFVGLHNKMVNWIEWAETQRKWNGLSAYKSKTVDQLLRQISKQRINVPERLRGHERAIFILAELTTRPKDPRFRMAFEAVIDAWRAEQLGFVFPVDLLHSRDAPHLPVYHRDTKVTMGRPMYATTDELDRTRVGRQVHVDTRRIKEWP